MKDKETLEEAAERWFKEIGRDASFIKAIEFGAKWKQEQMYSYEDMMFAYEQGARLALLSQSPLALYKGEFPNPEEWFNQYKEENKLWK